MKQKLRKLFVDELKEMLDAEEIMVKNFSKWVKVVDSPHLKQSLQGHIKESKGHISRLKQLFRKLKLIAHKKHCSAIRGLIRECTNVVADYPKSAFRDAALIAKIQHIEHFEMSAYGSLCAFAKELDLPNKAVSLLHDTFEEERDMDKMLTKIAKGNAFKPGVNRAANGWVGSYKMALGW